MKKSALTLLLAATAIQAEAVETVIVTATRTQQAVDASLAPVSIITREDIAKQMPKDVLDLLATTPGATITRNGGHGSNSSLFLRGNNSDHTLVLVDGQRIASATLGTASLQFIEPEMIERVEVVRGPRSSLYGSEAIGGVVQIFTRKTTEGIEPYIRVGTGDHDTRLAAAGIGVGNGSSYFNINGSYTDTAGIDNLEEDQGANADRDGYNNKSGSLRAGTQLGILHIDGSYYRTESRNDYDDTFVDPVFDPTASDYFSKNLIEAYSVQLSSCLTDFWYSSLSLGQSRDESFTDDRLHVDFFSPSEFNTERRSALWQNDFTLPWKDVLTVGTEYFRDEIDSNTAYPEDSRDNRAIFTQYQGDWGKYHLVAGIRTDDNEQFGRETTGNITIAYDISERLRAIASYGTAFKAPSFNELYFPFFGNPDFEPESSENTELELRGEHDRGGWSIAVFNNEIDDLIQYNPTIFAADQIGEASIRGVEVAGYTRLAGWQFSATASYMRPEDETTGNLLPRRPKKSGSLDIERSFGPLSVGASAVFQGQRFDDANNTTSLKRYGVVDLRTAYQINDDLRLQLNVRNALDKDYETAEGFNSEDRTAVVTLTYYPRLP